MIASNKDIEAEWKFTPVDINKDGFNSATTVKGKFVPAKNEWEGSWEA